MLRNFSEKIFSTLLLLLWVVLFALPICISLRKMPSTSNKMLLSLHEIKIENAMWNELSLKDKSELMRIMVENGISDLGTIKGIINEYANGGKLKKPPRPIPENTLLGKTSDILEGAYRYYAKQYIDNVVWDMENPTNKEFRNGKYYPYSDSNKDGESALNLGPGLNWKGGHKLNGKPLVYDGSRGYTKEEMNQAAMNYILPQVRAGGKQLVEKHGMDVLKFSEGDIGVMIDNAFNVTPRGKQKNLPNAFPKLTGFMIEGDAENAKKEMFTGSRRRQHLRMQLKDHGKMKGLKLDQHAADEFVRKSRGK